MKTMRTLICLALFPTLLHAGDAPADSRVPAPVGPEVLRLLEKKVDMEFDNVPVVEGLKMHFQLSGIPLEIAATPGTVQRAATYSAKEVSMIQAMRELFEKAGTQYRIVGKTIRIALPEEWKQIDAGTTTFENLMKKEKETK